MSRPWMPLYVADYLGDTGHLSTLEHGAYMLLIMNYWQLGELPTSDEDLATIVRLSLKDWLRMRTKIARLFQDGWHHKRIDAEIEAADRKYENLAAAGKRGGDARAKRLAIGKQKCSDATSDATGDAVARKRSVDVATHNSHSSNEELSSQVVESLGEGVVPYPVRGRQ